MDFQYIWAICFFFGSIASPTSLLMDVSASGLLWLLLWALLLPHSLHSYVITLTVTTGNTGGELYL
jgi:hypothetical protein